jgi:predicted dehydrogenase
MGRTHIEAWRAADRAGHANRLTAVCDRDPRRLEGKGPVAGNIDTGGAQADLFDPSSVRAYSEPEALLADPEVDIVSICTHTTTHVELALAALAAKKHVLLEKPVAIDSGAVERLAMAARTAEVLCMPAMCMRFWPGWDWLHERIAHGTFGAVRSATFQRLAGQPSWGREFYGDAGKSGGALFDLHVHDADFVHWCFGAPDSVSSTGSARHLTTLYRYAKGPEHVVAEGGWDAVPGAGLRMRYTIVFEEAVCDFDLARAPRLLLGRPGESIWEPVELETTTGYDGEVRHLLACVIGSEPRVRATLEDAEAVTRMLEAERASLMTDSPARP